jgi:hypothetical protein
MTRLTVTLEERVADTIGALDVPRLKASLVRLAADDPAWDELASSVADLDDAPSASAVIRQGLDFYLSAIERARVVARLDAGYAMLAADPGDGVVDALRARSQERFGDEP